MVCDKETNLKNGWNHYCSIYDKLAKIPLIGKFFKDDTIFGLYIGCPCKLHDIRYSIEGWASREISDDMFRIDILKQGRVQNKKIRAFFIAWISWISVRIGGRIVWKTWSSKWADRYQ